MKLIVALFQAVPSRAYHFLPHDMVRRVREDNTGVRRVPQDAAIVPRHGDVLLGRHSVGGTLHDHLPCSVQDARHNKAEMLSTPKGVSLLTNLLAQGQTVTRWDHGFESRSSACINQYM
jgi:hypothetical protein